MSSPQSSQTRHPSSTPPPQSSPSSPPPSSPTPLPTQPISTPPSTAPPPRPASPIAHTLPSKRALKAAALAQKIAHLEAELASIKAQQEEVLKQLPEGTDPDKVVKGHIHRLHVYNETKDVAMGLVGLVAVNRGVGVGEILEEFGVDGKD